MDSKIIDKNPSLDALEKALERKNQITRIAVVSIVVLLMVTGGWVAVGVWGYQPPEPTPLEKCLTGTFVEFQLDWCESLAMGSRISEEIAERRKAKVHKTADKMLNELEAMDPELRRVFEPLMAGIMEFDHTTLFLEDKSGELHQWLSPINEQLAKYEPRFYLDPEPFDGMVEDEFVSAFMLVVYEVLDHRVYTLSTGGDEPVELMVVRRRDTLDADAYIHGYVRRDDADAAFVLQDNATSFVADHLFPSLLEPDAAFNELFKDELPGELKKPYRVLMELVQMELQEAAGVDREALKDVARLVAKRASIFKSVEHRARKFGLPLKKPDGLLWPRSFTRQVMIENTELNQQGEELTSDKEMEQLSKLARQLDEDEANQILVKISDLMVQSVGAHEARHVVDVRGDTPLSDCIRQRVQIVDGDIGFLTRVDRETRAFLTQMLQSPASVRLTTMRLLNYLYAGRANVYGYAARTILHTIAYPEGESPPGGSRYYYLEDLTARLAALDVETTSQRARVFYEECFGPYEELELQESEAPDDSSGCQVNRW